MSDGPYGPPSPGDPQQPPGPPGPPSGPPGPPTPPGPPGPPPSAPGSPAGYPSAPPGPPPGYQQPGYQQPAYPPPGQPAYPPAGQPGYPPAQGGYGQPGGAYPPPKKSSNKGLWIGLGIAGVVLLLLCCGGIGWVIYSGFQAAQDEIERIEEETNDFPTEFPTPSVTPGSNTEESTGEVGTPISLGDVEFTVTAKPACGAGALGSGANKAEPLRGQFCQVPIRLANKGAESISWPCIRITMASTQDAKNYFSTSGNRAVTNSSTCNVDLGAGKTWDGKIVFDIEDGDTPSEVTFTEDYQDYAVVTL